MMLIQWVFMPINAIVYSSASAYAAQWRLMTGHYMDKFDVTEKAVKKDKIVDDKGKDKDKKASKSDNKNSAKEISENKS